MNHNDLAAGIVLAAGAGTRMQSDLPKVLHSIGGRTLVGHVLSAVKELKPQYLCAVVRHQAQRVADSVLANFPDTVIAHQDEIPGTGRAVWCALQKLIEYGNIEGSVLVTAGDTPLISTQIIEGLVQTHQLSNSAVTILTTTLEDPTGYGRIVRQSHLCDEENKEITSQIVDLGTQRTQPTHSTAHKLEANNQIMAVVEEKDATPRQRKITEVNTSTYVFEAQILIEALAQIGTNNSQGEMYLTDVISYAVENNYPVSSYHTEDSLAVEGANDQVQLANLGLELNKRICKKHMLAGVTITDPNSTWIDVEVQIGRQTTIFPFTCLWGKTQIGANCQVGPQVTIQNVSVHSGKSIRHLNWDQDENAGENQQQTEK